MGFLTRRDYSDGLRLVQDLGAGVPDPAGFARLGISLIPTLVPSELTTLSVCDLSSAKRVVVSNPGEAISDEARVCFNLFFREHPLVRYHASHPNGGSHKISDAFTSTQFRRTGLYNEYYRRIGIDHVIAVPLFVDKRLLVSFVLNRARRDFSERDRALLDLVRGPLANIYRHALALEKLRVAARALNDEAARHYGTEAVVEANGARLVSPVTLREREVLVWLTAGKTNQEIGTILGISSRTVEKHLEHLFVKLGVETRTAAVMRAAALAGAVRRSNH